METTVQIAGERIVLPAALAAQGVDPADQLLAEAAAFTLQQRVLLLGGSGVLAVLVGRRVPRGSVLVIDQRTHMLAAAAASMAANSIPGECRSTTDLPLLMPSSFDQALINISFQPNSARLLELLQVIHCLVKPGGRVLLAGGRKRGVDTAIKRLGEVFGQAQVAAYRKGFRVAVAERAEGEAQSAAAQPPVLTTVELRGAGYTLEAHAGVFAGGGLDPAAAMLCNAIDVANTDNVLDLGCGSGIVGMVAARLSAQGHVWLVDANSEAVELARRNLARNGIGNATALVSDSTAAVAEQLFDAVVCNPPFHEGRRADRSLGLRLIHDGAAALRTGGRCFIVANRFLPYEAAMRELLDDVREVAGDTRFKVVCGVRR